MTFKFKPSELFVLVINNTSDPQADIYTSRNAAEKGKTELLAHWKTIIDENSSRGISTGVFPIEIMNLEDAQQKYVDDRDTENAISEGISAKNW